MDVSWSGFYDSFIEYQTRMLKVFDRMTEEYGFHVLDASTSVRRVAATLRRAVTRVIESDHPVDMPVAKASSSQT